MAAKKPRDLAAEGAKVVSVFGPFSNWTMVQMPTGLAEEFFPGGLGNSGRVEVIDAAMKDVEAIREVSEDLAGSVLAAAMVQMAFELAHPYNSATSKAACAAQLRDCFDRLKELLPDDEEEDALSELAGRPTNLVRRAGTATSVGAGQRRRH